MTVAPSGIMSRPMLDLATLLSACEAFQAWVGAEDSTGALDSVYYVEAEGPLRDKRPYAVVDVGDGWKTEKIGEVGTYLETGTLRLCFEWNIDESVLGSPADEQMTFLNAIGGIIEDMLELSDRDYGGVRAHLNVRNLRQTSGPSRSEPIRKGDRDGDYYQIWFDVEWGI